MSIKEVVSRVFLSRMLLVAIEKHEEDTYRLYPGQQIRTGRVRWIPSLTIR
jgi:hypothetical protein